MLFTELVQLRKLRDRDPQLPRLADKILVKAFVAERLGTAAVTPTAWEGRSLPAAPAWPFPYVVKSRHGCGHTVVVRDAAGHRAAVAASRGWMARPYGAWLDEWLYGEIERGLLVEPFIGDGHALPVDFKVFVFGGKARFVQVHLDRAKRHRWIVFDTDWRRVSEATDDPDPPPPSSLAAMLRSAERLAEGFCFVRADFYEVEGAPRFGELTFYPGSGLEKVEPPRLDLLMGLMWMAAQPGWTDAAMHLAG